MSQVDVAVGVSRWEGLGLHLYEFESSERLIVVNEMEPYVSHALGRGNCVFVGSHEIGELRGIPVHEPDFSSLADAFDRLSSPDCPAFARGPTDPGPAWRQMTDALNTMITTLLGDA